MFVYNVFVLFVSEAANEVVHLLGEREKKKKMRMQKWFATRNFGENHAKTTLADLEIFFRGRDGEQKSKMIQKIRISFSCKINLSIKLPSI